MNETWKRWEGRTVDGRFPLQSYLGGSDHSAVFLTIQRNVAGNSEKAAIKLISSGADSEKQLQRWRSARDLNHPNLIRILDAGRCKLDGTKLLYVVEECAEENLAQILPERALTAEETRGMLPPILRALHFVHSKGLLHGHIQPSNILAVGEEVKLSSDALSAPGENGGGAITRSSYAAPEVASGMRSTAGDVWQLGIALLEVLTQRGPGISGERSKMPEIPASVPEPFREIAGRCLQIEPGKRWTIADILERLGEKRPEARPAPASAPVERASSAAAVSSPRKVSAKWSYLLVLAALLALAFIFIPRPKPSSPSSSEVSTPTQRGTAERAPAQQEPTQAAAANPDSQSGVVQRVVPAISQSARHSIHGTIQVRVSVKVDAAGHVEVAELESSRASKYFKGVALDAARDWKFVPARAGESDAREWKLQFAFSRAQTEATALPAKR